MVDQFKAEKCLHAASTDNLVLMITDNRSYPRAAPRQPLGQPPGNSDGTNPGTRAESRCKPRGLPREMLALGIDWCISSDWRRNKHCSPWVKKMIMLLCYIFVELQKFSFWKLELLSKSNRFLCQFSFLRPCLCSKVLPQLQYVDYVSVQLPVGLKTFEL